MKIYINKKIEEESKKVFQEISEIEKKINKKRNLMINQIEEIQSKKYKKRIIECLNKYRSWGELKFVDISMVKGYYKKENWDEFDHIYIDPKTNSDDFGGYIYIPITKNLYLKSYYSM